MSIRYNVVVQKEEDWYVAKCLDNSVASQGKTIEESLKNLKEALELYYENEEPIIPKEIYITTLEVAIWVINIQYYHLTKIIDMLQKFDYEKVSQKGSHSKFRNLYTNKVCIIPMHKEIARGTLKSILEQANISIEDFLNQL